MSIVVARLVVDFNGGDSNKDSSGTLRLEIDGRDDGLNGGRSSGFRVGDTVYYLMYKTSNVSLQVHKSTDGAIASVSSGTRIITDEPVEWSGSQDASVQYPVAGGAITVSPQGSFFDENGGTMSSNTTLLNQTTLQLSKPGYGVALVSYSTNIDIFRLNSVAEKRALVLAIGRV